MPFFSALKRFLGSEGERPEDPDARVRLVEAWGLSDTSHPEFPGAAPAADPAAMAAPPDPIAYDREQWRRKLKRLLDKLPASEPEWDAMLADGRALGLDEGWMFRAQVEEFTLLIRRAVADRNVTPQEHRKLDLARRLIGMDEAEAAALVDSIVAEAETFFGGAVEKKAMSDE